MTEEDCAVLRRELQLFDGKQTASVNPEPKASSYESEQVKDQKVVKLIKVKDKPELTLAPKFNQGSTRGSKGKNAQVIVLHQTIEDSGPKWWALVQKRSSRSTVMAGEYAAIGGMSDPGEWSKQTALREVQEETGLTQNPLVLNMMGGSSKTCDWFVMVIKPEIMKLQIETWSRRPRGRRWEYQNLRSGTATSFDPRPGLLAGLKAKGRRDPCFDPSKQTSRDEVFDGYPHIVSASSSDAETPIGHCWVPVDELESIMSQAKSKPGVMKGLERKVLQAKELAMSTVGANAAVAAVGEHQNGGGDAPATGSPQPTIHPVVAIPVSTSCLKVNVVVKAVENAWAPTCVVVDPAGLDYIQKYGPDGAGSGSRSIYNTIGLKRHFPKGVKGSIKQVGDAKYHEYNKRQHRVIHTVGPNYAAGTGELRADRDLATVYKNVFREFAAVAQKSTAKLSLRILPVSTGVFSGGRFPAVMASKTFNAMHSGFNALSKQQQTVISATGGGGGIQLHFLNPTTAAPYEALFSPPGGVDAASSGPGPVHRSSSALGSFTTPLGQCCIDGTVIKLCLDEAPPGYELVPAGLVKWKRKRDGMDSNTGEIKYHITIMSQSELAVVLGKLREASPPPSLKDAKLQILTLAKESLQDTSDLVFVEGLRRYNTTDDDGRDRDVFWVSVDWPAMQAFRAKYGLAAHSAHITLGFRGDGGDIHTIDNSDDQWKVTSEVLKQLQANVGGGAIDVQQLEQRKEGILANVRSEKRVVEQDIKRYKKHEQAAQTKLDRLNKSAPKVDLSKLKVNLSDIDILKVAPGSPEYKEAMKYVPADAQIQVQRIKRVKIPARHAKMKAAELTFHAPGLKYNLFHGTKTATAGESIARDGPDLTLISGHAYGKGFYLSDQFTTSHPGYTGGTGSLLICDVAVGKQLTQGDSSYTYADVRAKGCDSIHDNHFVIFEPDSVYVKFLVEFGADASDAEDPAIAVKKKAEEAAQRRAKEAHDKSVHLASQEAICNKNKVKGALVYIEFCDMVETCLLSKTMKVESGTIFHLQEWEGLADIESSHYHRGGGWTVATLRQQNPASSLVAMQRCDAAAGRDGHREERDGATTCPRQLDRGTAPSRGNGAVGRSSW